MCRAQRGTSAARALGWRQGCVLHFSLTVPNKPEHVPGGGLYVRMSSRQPWEVDTALIPVILKKKLRHRKVQTLAQGHREVVQLRSAAASACGGLGKWYTWWNPSLEGGGHGGVNHSFSPQGQKLVEHLLCSGPRSRQWGAAGNKTPFPCEVHLLVWEDLKLGEKC